jgi:hypothetical protein
MGLLLAVPGARAASLSLQGTYWDADVAGEGMGGGLKIKRPMAQLGAADFRIGYVQFDDVKTDLIPFEGTVMLRLPFFIEPYLGIGGGYYYADSAIYDSGFGWYGAAGLELHVLMLGIFGEVRQMEMSKRGLSGPSANVGLMLRW